MENVSKTIQSKIVEVRVIDAYPSGLNVQTLKTGEIGFVPRREITWERRASIPFILPEAGETFSAILLNSKTNRLTFSLRQVHDPWREVAAQRKYKLGQIVIGEVVNVRYFGAYVQLEPGIDALIHPREASFAPGENIEDLLWVGDKIEAEIIDINLYNKYISLSITKAQQTSSLPLSVDEQARKLLLRFDIEGTQPLLLNTVTSRPMEQLSIPQKRVNEQIKNLSSILLVDDDLEWQARIGAELEKVFEVHIDKATNSQEALKKFQRGTTYDLVVADIHLSDDDGVELAQTLREINPRIPIILTSKTRLQSILNQYPNGIINDEFLFAQKDDNVNAICRKIADMRSGIAHTDTLSLSKENAWIQRLGLQAFSDQAEPIVIDAILAWLQSETSVSYCFLLKSDEKRREITISASHPVLSRSETQYAQDGLYYSVANQIFEENRIFTGNSIKVDARKYKNFFQNINFNSYLGIPIQIPGQGQAIHVLVLLDDDNYAFVKNEGQAQSKFALAQFAAYFISIALERASMFHIMRKYEAQYSRGELAHDLIHEMGNKLNALNTNIKTVERIRDQKLELSNPSVTKQWHDVINNPLKEISNVNEELKELLSSYVQQVDSKSSAFDLNQTIFTVLRQLHRTADQKNVRLFEKKEKFLPLSQGYQASVKQVILNLTLNAIQMRDLHQRALIEIRQQSLRHVPLPEAGMVLIQTKYIKDDPHLPIEVRIMDDGPGIHWREWEHIFAPGVSKRGGSGLGLYISRNLIERMGGKLFLLKSILFIGSAFVIRLPAAPDEENQNA